MATHSVYSKKGAHDGLRLTSLNALISDTRTGGLECCLKVH